jgi:hypothetical protein
VGEVSEDVNLELSRSAAIDIVSYRADKRFRIFSWASALLIGTIAGQAHLPRSEESSRIDLRGAGQLRRGADLPQAG